MKIEYVAFDGTRFNSKDLCNIYEKNKEAEFIKTKRLAFWSTTDGTLTTENIGSTNFLYLDNEEGNLYVRASIMFIKDQEVLNYMRSAYNIEQELGFYFWNGEGKWISAKEIKEQCCDTLERINGLEKEWNNAQVEPINLSKIWNGVDPTLKDELMIDDDGIVYPF